MSDDYTFRLEQTADPRGQYLVYEAGDCRLKVYLEMSGVRHFDWLAAEQSFETWTKPAGEAIAPADRELILRRLSEWGKDQRLRINVSRGMTRQEYFDRMVREGWQLHETLDGNTIAIPPPRKPLRERLRLLGRWLAGTGRGRPPDS